MSTEKQQKQRKPMSRRGKSSKAKEVAQWERELSAFWSAHPIEYCEVRFKGCYGTYGLSPAHSMKRVYAKRSKQTFFEVVAACKFCHDYLDQKMSHEQMEQTVKEIIKKRGFDALNPKGH